MTTENMTLLSNGERPLGAGVLWQFKRWNRTGSFILMALLVQITAAQNNIAIAHLLTSFCYTSGKGVAAIFPKTPCKSAGAR